MLILLLENAHEIERLEPDIIELVAEDKRVALDRLVSEFCTSLLEECSNRIPIISFGYINKVWCTS